LFAVCFENASETVDCNDDDDDDNDDDNDDVNELESEVEGDGITVQLEIEPVLPVTISNSEIEVDENTCNLDDLEDGDDVTDDVTDDDDGDTSVTVSLLSKAVLKLELYAVVSN
jgi:hypothetical protein